MTDVAEQRRIILERIRQRLQSDDLDGYLAYTPANNLYCSGFVSWFVGEHWRFHGGQLTLIPADPSIPTAMILPEVEAPMAEQCTEIAEIRGYGMWIETRPIDVLRAPPTKGTTLLQRPTWRDTAEEDSLLRDILGSRDLLDSRIGTDLSYAMAESVDRLLLAAPRVTWVNWTRSMFDLRAIKQPFEIDRLTRAVELQESAFKVVRDSLRKGLTAEDIRRMYARAVLDAAESNPRYSDFQDSWLLVSVGNDGGIGDQSAHPLTSGDVVSLDGGVRVGGYKSDGGRTFSFGGPSDQARHLHETLLQANTLALDALIPGHPVAEAFIAAENHLRSNGFPQYSRGQFGHSIGLEQFPEEPPFIARDEWRTVEAGMVFAVETPYYGGSVGSMTIEDMVVITEHGPEKMHRLPRSLVVVG